MEKIMLIHVSAERIITCRVFYKGNGDMKKVRILSFGVNQMGDSDGIIPGIHAEQDALDKLIPLRKKKKLEPINLLVIRLSTKNKLQSSKPCSTCIEKMRIFPPKKGYKIHYIYYSDGEGKIVKTTLSSLENEEKHYSRYYRQRKHALE
jgi:cytidine deaminase